MAGEPTGDGLMADTQILNPSVEDAESVYQVPGPVTFVLKAVNADFADNGAAGSWLPAVVVVSDSGHVIARAVDQAVLVAAGGSAAVSFFPGVKHAASSAVAGAPGYPTLQDAALFLHSQGEDGSNFGLVSIDTGAVNNAVKRVNNASSAGAFFTRHFRLGPKGSLWCVSMLYSQGPAFGKLHWFWGTPAEDWPASGISPSEGLLQGAAGDGLAYVECDPTRPIDGYAVVATKNVLADQASLFRIMGDDGAPLTAFTSTPFGWFNADGGAGVWNLQPTVVDKRGAATGFDFRIAAMVVMRLDYLGF